MSSITAANKKEKILAILKDVETKGEVKSSIVEGLKTTAAGISGAFIGSAIGRPSFVIGIVTTMAGHYFGSNKFATFGVGMIATGGAKLLGGVEGTPANGFEGVKERMKAVAQDFKHRLYIDKFIKPKKKADEGTSGLGEVQYFKFPSKELDLGSIDAIEREILYKTEMPEEQMRGGDEDVNGNSYEDVTGMEDKIY
jgi:hypothetical protein